MVVLLCLWRWYSNVHGIYTLYTCISVISMERSIKLHQDHKSTSGVWWMMTNRLKNSLHHYAHHLPNPWWMVTQSITTLTTQNPQDSLPLESHLWLVSTHLQVHAIRESLENIWQPSNLALGLQPLPVSNVFIDLWRLTYAAVLSWSGESHLLSPRPPHTPFDPVAPLPLDNGLRSPVLSHHAPQRDGISYTLSGCKR